MKLRSFKFPSYEEWEKDHEFEEKIGDYTCVIRAISWSTSGYIEYAAAISSEGNPLNLYAKKNCFFYINCKFSEEDKIKKWYNSTVSKLEKNWARIILDSYFE